MSGLMTRAMQAAVVDIGSVDCQARTFTISLGLRDLAERNALEPIWFLVVNEMKSTAMMTATMTVNNMDDDANVETMVVML